MSDGNSPITCYVVKKADASTRTFTIAGHTDSDTLEFKVSQPSKGKQYLIQVFAKNMIGQSEPVSLPEPVRLPLGECVIQLSCFVFLALMFSFCFVMLGGHCSTCVASRACLT